MSYAFIQSSVTFDLPLPYNIADEYSVDRATRQQTAVIKERLEKFRAFQQHTDFNYEVSKQAVVDGPGTSYLTTQLPEAEWRYWVINFDGFGNSLSALTFALYLLKDAIHVGFRVIEHQEISGVSDNLAFTFQFYSDPDRLYEFPRVVSLSELQEAGRFFSLIKSAEAKQLFVYRALQNFVYFRAFSSHSIQQILFCFSVLESLLTHNPNDKEVGDSLTHQLRTKVALLEKMFVRSLDFSAFRKDAKAEEMKWKRAIWSKLYAYRSNIAHGNRFDFQKDFRELTSHETVLAFLREVTKLVLLVGLEKPDFLEDLKAV